MKTVTDLQGNKLYHVVDDNFIAPEGQIVVDFIPDEPLTAEQIFENQKIYETEQYLKRMDDGRDSVAKLSAELRTAKLNGIISEEDHKGIDALLVPMRTAVLAGQWVEAKDILISLGSEQIGQGLYDKINYELTTYISENYQNG